MNQVSVILNDRESREFWIHHFGMYDESNYKESPFYQHEFNLFHVERSYEKWVYLTAWAVHSHFLLKNIERQVKQVSLPHSLPVDNLVKILRGLIRILEEVC